MNILNVGTLPIGQLPIKAFSEVRQFGLHVPREIADQVNGTGLPVSLCYEQISPRNPNHYDFYAWRATSKGARCVRVVYDRRQ